MGSAILEHSVCPDPVLPATIHGINVYVGLLVALRSILVLLECDSGFEGFLEDG